MGAPRLLKSSAGGSCGMRPLNTPLQQTPSQEPPAFDCPPQIGTRGDKRLPVLACLQSCLRRMTHEVLVNPAGGQYAVQGAQAIDYLTKLSEGIHVVSENIVLPLSEAVPFGGGGVIKIAVWIVTSLLELTVTAHGNAAALLKLAKKALWALGLMFAHADQLFDEAGSDLTVYIEDQATQVCQQLRDLLKKAPWDRLSHRTTAKVAAFFGAKHYRRYLQEVDESLDRLMSNTQFQVTLNIGAVLEELRTQLAAAHADITISLVKQAAATPNGKAVAYALVMASPALREDLQSKEARATGIQVRLGQQYSRMHEVNNVLLS